jgi:hypothetical protein
MLNVISLVKAKGALSSTTALTFYVPKFPQYHFEE